LEICEQHSNFGACGEQDQKDKEQEPKDVVVIVHPYGLHHVVQFDKARIKGQNPSNRQGEGNAHEPRLVGNLSRDAAVTE
jgi:hypothetical protein